MPMFANAGRGAQRKGCGNNIRKETVDNLVCQIMIGLKRPIMKIVFIPGNDHSAQLADVQFQLKQLANEDLTDEQYDAELARLRAERDRIRELPIEPGRVERVDTGQTYASRWATLQTDTERNDWLRSAGVKIWAWRNPDDAEAVGKVWADEIRQALSESVTAEALGTASWRARTSPAGRTVTSWLTSPSRHDDCHRDADSRRGLGLFRRPCHVGDGHAA
jgi:hypothetical protein